MTPNKPQPIQRIFTGNVNLSTSPRLSVLDLNRNETNTQSAIGAMGMAPATTATQLDSVTVMLRDTVKTGKHFADLIDSAMELVKNLEVPADGYEMRTNRRKLGHELYDMRKAAVKLVEILNRVNYDPCES